MTESGAFVSLSVSQLDDSLPRPEFVEVIEPSNLCVQCQLALIQACQTTCGHRLCSGCVNKHGSGPFHCPANDDGCETMTVDQVRPDFSTRRLMANLKVYCMNKQQGCDETILWKNLKDHIYTKCVYSITVCPLNCGEIKLLRCKVEDHLQSSCSKQIRTCWFASFGCEFQGIKSELENHLSTRVAVHLELAVVRVTELTLSNTQLSGDVAELKNELSEVNRQCSQYAKTIEQLKQQVDVNASNFVHIEQLVKNSVASQNKTTEKVDRLLVEQQSVHERIDKTEKLIQSLPISNGKKALSNSGFPEEVRLQMISHDRTISHHDVRLAEIDLRLQCSETTSYDGCLIWKITEYRRRKQEAISGDTISLYSQPFFTSRYGYKLCARVYLNGDGSGKGTHVSFFLVVMQGDYDELLAWPFRQRVTLCLMDQRTQRHHLADAFRPDPSSSSFQKPTSQMNVASGCPKFIEHAKLETRNSPLLVNDTLFFKIIVDSSDLWNP